MTRRLLLLAAPFAGPLAAASAAEQAYELVVDAASFLASGNAEGFLALFDPSMPGYETFADQVRGLLVRYEAQSSVAPLGNEGDEGARALELDWDLTLRSRHETAAVVRRREKVRCVVRKAGRRWRFFSFAPQSLLAA